MLRQSFLLLFAVGLATIARSQSITLSGEPNLMPDQYSIITWPADSIHSDKVKIDFSTDGGMAWQVIATESAGNSYEWMAPHHHQDDIVRITDDAQDTLYSDPFSVREGDLVGVEMGSRSVQLLPYPNPAIGYITIAQTCGEIRIYDAAGRSFSCPTQSNGQCIRLDVRSLPGGEYWIEWGGKLNRFSIVR